MTMDRAPCAPNDGRAHGPGRDGALLRAFFTLAQHWRLSDDDQRTLLGGVSPATLDRLREVADGRGRIALERDQADRLACLLAIHRALRMIYADEGIAVGWVWRPHEDFGGRT